MRFRYRGLDGQSRTTHLRFTPAPSRLTAREAIYRLELKPRGHCLFFVEVSCNRPPQASAGREAFFGAMMEARRALRRSASRAAAIETSNEHFNEAMRRSVSDLYMLVTDTTEGAYPYAGTPWYSAPFGRDALITALETLWLDPELARGVLRYLAANQATSFDPAADAEPGKILHEVRHGEMANLKEVPFQRYYGSVDATPLFVMLAGAYLERTGDLSTARELWPHVEAALTWIRDHGDRDGDGFVEYERRTADGLINQGWKDSHDSIFHADGSLATGAIALCEVQAYVYAAHHAGALIARRLGRSDQAERLEGEADALKARFEAAFWSDSLGTYALALDGAKRPCLVRASNAGHALFAGIALPHRAYAIASSLMQPSSFSGWGIRTVASTEARYNPMSYHNGSVWPHDNALIAAGLARYGFKAETARVLQGLFDAAIYIDLRRLPELFCGFPRRRAQGPIFYPVACAPQAWAAASLLSVLQSCLGITFRPEQNTVRLEHPVLPASLQEVTLRNLRVGQGCVDLLVRRAGMREVAAQVIRREGRIQVEVAS